MEQLSKVKDGMVLYHLGYKWSNDGGSRWRLHDEKGDVVVSVTRDCFPSKDHNPRSFAHKCALLLPDIHDGKNFNILFHIYKDMSVKHNSSFTGIAPSLEDADTIGEYCDSVINASLDCIFGE